MEEMIKKYYSEYKNFMGENDLPEIYPVFSTIDKIDKNVLAYVNIDEIEESVVPIYMDKDILLYEKSYLKSILFHEFTHIFDKIVVFKDTNNTDKLNKLMSSFSEYHASQVEMLAILGYKKYKRNR